MDYKNDKITYYVSNLANNTISIIDGEKNIITNEINIPCRPFKLSLYKNKYLYVASNENTIMNISILTNDIKTFNIPNNGVIEIDNLNNKIYISNTYEILVYDIETEKKLACIKGFIAVEDLKIDSLGKRLFVLDMYSKELKVYDTVNFKLLLNIKNVGIKPKYVLLSNDDEVLYIANEGGRDINSGNISVINIKNKNIINIPFQANSSITSLVLKDNILYVANKGLNRIELMDILTNKLVGSIKTTFSEPQSLLLTPNKDKLLVTSRNSGQRGAVEIIDTNENYVLNTILMKENNTEPYDIAILNHRINDITDYSPVILKKVFFTLEEKMNIKDVVGIIPKKYNKSIISKEIIIDNGFIVKGTETRIPIKDRPNFYKVEFILKIPYYIKIKHDNELINIKKFIEEKKEMILFIPSINNAIDDLKLKVKTYCEITNNPILIKDVLSFSLKVLLRVKVVGEIEAILPFKL